MSAAPAALKREPAGRTTLTALIVAAMFIDAVFFAVIAPLLPHYSDQLGLGQLQIGLLFAAHPLGTVLFAPLAARSVRRRGGRFAMTVGLAALGLATIVFGFAEFFALLVLCRFVQGASAAMVWCGGLARLQGTAPPQRRGAALGLAGSAGGAGSLFGPAVAALCAVVSIALVLGVLGALALGLCFVLYAAGETAEERIRESEVAAAGGISVGRVARPLGVIVVCGLVFGAVATLGPLQLDHLGAGVAAIAAVFALAAVGETLVSPFAGHVSDLVGRMPPIRLILLLAIPLLAIQAATGSPWVMAGAVALTGATIASLWPLGTALLADESSVAERSPAGVFAASVIAWSAGLAGGSLLCSALAESAGEAVAYSVLAAACALSLLSLVGISPRPANAVG